MALSSIPCREKLLEEGLLGMRASKLEVQAVLPRSEFLTLILRRAPILWSGKGG